MSAMSDVEWMVRAIRRRNRMENILHAFLFCHAGCSWTREGRRKQRQFDRVWPRIREDFCAATGANWLQAIMCGGVEDAVTEHVKGCACRVCRDVPIRRKIDARRRLFKCWSRAHA